MLPFRRVLAFSSRIHTYLLVLLLFFALMFCFALSYPVEEAFVSLILTAMTVISWTLVFEGVWIILASFFQLFYSKVFAFTPVLLTLLRLAAGLLITLSVDVLNRLIVGGLSF